MNLRSSPTLRAFISVTAVLVLINLGVYAAQVVSGIPWEASSPDQQIAWGGNLAVLTLTGDAWRLATNVFLHAGLLHLALNMYMLGLVGPRAERLLGRPAMLAVYLAGGLLASCASAWWLIDHAVGVNILGQRVTTMVVSVGASGAIMALCGALLAVIGIDALHGEEPAEPGFGKALAQVVGINLALGLFVKGTDQAAHIGGLVAGLAMGAAIGHIDTVDGAIRWLRLGGATLAAAGCVWLAIHRDTDEQALALRAEFEKHRHAEAAAAQTVDDAATAKSAIADEIRSLPTPVAEAAAFGREVAFGGGGVSFAMSADEKTAYALAHHDNRIAVIDVTSGEVRQTIEGPRVPIEKLMPGTCHDIFCGGTSVADIAVLRDQSLALVTSMHRNAVTFVDLRDGRVLDVVPVGDVPNAVVVSPDQRRAFVHNRASNSISVVDIAARKVVTTLSFPRAGTWPTALRLPMWFNTEGSRLNIAALDRDTPIRTYDVDTLAPVESRPMELDLVDAIPIAGDPHADVIAVSSDALRLLDATTHEPRTGWALCGTVARVAAAASAGKVTRVALTGHRDGDGNDQWIDVADLNTRVSLGRYPLHGVGMKLLFSHDGTKLFVVNNLGSFVVIDLAKRLAGPQDLVAPC